MSWHVINQYSNSNEYWSVWKSFLKDIKHIGVQAGGGGGTFTIGQLSSFWEVEKNYFEM